MVAQLRRTHTICWCLMASSSWFASRRRCSAPAPSSWLSGYSRSAAQSSLTSWHITQTNITHLDRSSEFCPWSKSDFSSLYFQEILPILKWELQPKSARGRSERVPERLVCARHHQRPLGHHRNHTEDGNTSKGETKPSITMSCKLCDITYDCVPCCQRVCLELTKYRHLFVHCYFYSRHRRDRNSDGWLQVLKQFSLSLISQASWI